MKNLIQNSKFKIIEKPYNLHAQSQSTIYYDILDTLEVIDAEKCIQISRQEIKNQIGGFRTYLKQLCKKLDKKFYVASSYDEDKEVLFVWKRDKLNGRS